MKILVMGLPGNGKICLSEILQPLIESALPRRDIK